MPPSNPIPFLIGRVVGAVGLIDAHAAQGTPEGAFFVSDAEPNEAEDPACGVNVASRPGAEAA
jgi:hypothetical protein